jgi:demethylmenaquinone methyltransferase/2-methoxy-6-polyprenyl-1,4-benzoquinol methylase
MIGKENNSPGLIGNQQTEDKDIPSRENVWKMFNRISNRYDLLNRLLSLRQDVAWRKQLVRNLPDVREQQILDLATGTADVLWSFFSHSTRLKYGVGIDMAKEMLALGREKLSGINPVDSAILFPADVEFLPFKNNQFQAVSIAFGIRNVMNVRAGLAEMYRVLADGGRVLILEFSIPRNMIIKKIYLFYFRHILPRIGGFISGDRDAYQYLNETVETFPYGEAFCHQMREVGFQDVRGIPLTFGIATLYRGDRLQYISKI